MQKKLFKNLGLKKLDPASLKGSSSHYYINSIGMKNMNCYKHFAIDAIKI